MSGPRDTARLPPELAGGIHDADFAPHPLLRSAHLQTIVPTLLRPTPRLELDIERWELPDGDFVDLGWFGRPQPGAPIAVLVHGLTGGFHSKYLRGLARRLLARGWGGLVLELRGAGEEPNRLPQNYHQGDTADLIALLWRLRADFPDSPLATVGWSLGGNVVLKAAGECGADHPADIVAAASVPFELEPCVWRMREGFSRLYQQRLMRCLHLSLRRKVEAMALPAGVDPEKALTAEDFYVFDDAWTAPLNGFADARDYYARCQCGPFLRAIRRPTLIVHSSDDPFMQPQIVPPAAALAPDVRLELSRHGGHVGFLAANAWGGFDWWLERRLADWLQSATALRKAAEA